MKEIIKYLRTTNSFTQDEVAQKLGLSRQSYIKYENGTVIPSDKIVGQIAEIYGVEKRFIYENKIPKIAGAGSDYKIRSYKVLTVNESSPAYSAVAVKTKIEEKIDYDAYVDNGVIKIVNPNFKLKQGAHLKIEVIESEDEKIRREKAIKYLETKIEENKGKFHFEDDDPYYKKAIGRAKDEKYGFTY